MMNLAVLGRSLLVSRSLCCTVLLPLSSSFSLQVTSGLAQLLLYSIVASIQQSLSPGHFWSRVAFAVQYCCLCPAVSLCRSLLVSRSLSLSAGHLWSRIACSAVLCFSPAVSFCRSPSCGPVQLALQCCCLSLSLQQSLSAGHLWTCTTCSAVLLPLSSSPTLAADVFASPARKPFKKSAKPGAVCYSGFLPIRASLAMIIVIIVIIYPLIARVVGAPQMIRQPVSSIFPCSPLPYRTWRTPGLMLSSHLFLCPPCLLPPFTVLLQDGFGQT